MTQDRRLTCPECGKRIDKLVNAPGVTAAYPCADWLHPDRVARLRRNSERL